MNTCAECIHAEMCRWMDEVERDGCDFFDGDPWIPVSERLPEDSDEYFVTVIDEDVETYNRTKIAWYAHPKDYDVEEGDWRELMTEEKVIAWMPLPKPFEPQESEE